MSGWSMAIKESIFSIKLAVGAGAGGGFKYHIKKKKHY
jgi:hypothetical protein